MQFLDQKKRSVVVNGERVWEDDPRYRELTKKEKKEKPEADAADKEEEEEEEAWREEQWKEDSAIIKSWFTPKLFAKVAAWIALFYYLGPNARPAFVFATFFALIFLNLGKREEGELSAYNVFNPNFQRLQGDNLAEQFEAQLRNVPVQQLRNRQQQQRQGRARPAASSASSGSVGDSGEESEVDIDSLKPRDKVIVSHHQGPFPHLKLSCCACRGRNPCGSSSAG